MATITYKVTVATGTNKYGTGNKYYINGEANVVLYLQEGNTYIFDQSDNSNSTHRLAFSTTDNGTWGGGTEYTTGVTVTGSAGTDGKTTIVVFPSVPAVPVTVTPVVYSLPPPQDPLSVVEKAIRCVSFVESD